ncbi:MAG: F0F1 ATP synthase subunit A [Acidobacteria bacterium]|nr:F0F1 ATP synthase subunit A [Acidobacteriota bacterium]
MGEWFTSLLNTLFAGPVVAVEGMLGIHPDNPAHPIPVYVAMQILVAAVIIILLAVIRKHLSVDKPGKLQQLMELIANGLASQGEDIIGHGAKVFVPLLFTLAIFIFLCNVIGLIPTLESPTGLYQPSAAFPMMGIYVTLGCALVVLSYYHYWGIRHHGVLGYLKTFMGPVIFIAWIMVPIELVSHLARGLSLSVRLFANMMAGQLVTGVFFTLVPLVVPAFFEGLHVAVALLQTFIFILLTMVYLAGAVSEEH